MLAGVVATGRAAQAPSSDAGFAIFASVVAFTAVRCAGAGVDAGAPAAGSARLAFAAALPTWVVRATSLVTSPAMGLAGLQIGARGTTKLLAGFALLGAAAARAQLFGAAAVVAFAAMRRVFLEVHASRPAEHSIVRALAHAGPAELALSACQFANAAMALVALKVDTGIVTKRPAGRARARAVYADLVLAAGGVALATVRLAATDVDARRSAGGKTFTIRLALPHRTQLARSASVAARAAVFAVGEQISAAAVASRRAAGAAAATAAADLRLGAGEAARATVFGIAGEVGASSVAVFTARCTRAAPSHANAVIAASISAVPAVARVGAHVDTGPPARDLEGPAALHAVCPAAHLVRRALAAAATAVIGIGGDVETAVLAAHQATCAETSALHAQGPHAAGVSAHPAVRWIDEHVHAVSGAVGQARRAFDGGLIARISDATRHCQRQRDARCAAWKPATHLPHRLSRSSSRRRLARRAPASGRTPHRRRRPSTRGRYRSGSARCCCRRP